MNKKKRVFLGGTCNTSTWRQELIELLNEDIEYFNPVVKDWKYSDLLREIEERNACDYVLYTITKDMTGVYSIAEAVEDSIKRPGKTLFCLLEEGFGSDQLKSLHATLSLIEKNGATTFYGLNDLANHLNNITDHDDSTNDVNFRIIDGKIFVNMHDHEFPLVSESTFQLGFDGKTNGKCLTVLNYEKWYTFYLVKYVDNIAVMVTNVGFKEFEYSVDHAVEPESFHNYCIENGYHYDNKTFAKICERWVEDTLDSDWTKLSQYLPSNNKE